MPDLEKLKRLIHYVAWKAGTRDWFGATKLYKVLWFADARQFVLKKKPITGAVYIREKYGPVPKQAMAVRAQLEKEGAVKITKQGRLTRSGCGRRRTSLGVRHFYSLCRASLHFEGEAVQAEKGYANPNGDGEDNASVTQSVVSFTDIRLMGVQAARATYHTRMPADHSNCGG
jgi:hypothetical protein